MSAAESSFPDLSAEVAARLVDVKRVIETVGVELIEASPAPEADRSNIPANHNDVIPFAATLRRVGLTGDSEEAARVCSTSDVWGPKQ